MNRRYFLLLAGATGLVIGLPRLPLASKLLPLTGTSDDKGGGTSNLKTGKTRKGIEKVSTKVTKSNEEWKKVLTADQYSVTREKGTERPFSSPLNEIHSSGVFECVNCGLPLFDSDAKFDSGTGWPSFYQPIVKENVREEVDQSLWMTRTEVLCARCDAHLGHVFDDGPKPTGLRYCMNGVALKFVEDK